MFAIVEGTVLCWLSMMLITALELIKNIVRGCWLGCRGVGGIIDNTAELDSCRQSLIYIRISISKSIQLAYAHLCLCCLYSSFCSLQHILSKC